ncbi:NUDIX hydrolase [Mesobacillus maritimus]|uniref:NUDIX hydrolase n=1 Tax=Mesobacillus maritimus TaxID=1643336 RepID=UPI00203B77A8|nr:NUDIX hydrolase [Mesobacillus maritimus]MCM3584291.1 NUDIX hydrolase [Mesobacillus maritimus]MCM3669292.1 NUDIX hydrolase [Mesobacillus maritimus]
MDSNLKPASTVVLIDEKTRVYLTKRPKTMRFLGGYFVFPGGAVEQEDAIIDDYFVINRKENEDFHAGYYIAAARELFEEVGILLARQDDGHAARLDLGIEQEYRRQLLAGEISFSSILKQEKLYFDFNSLTYFGHRITPKQSPIRFDTRFFIATLPTNQTPRPDDKEIAEAVWMRPETALNQYKQGKLPLVPPTIDSLETILSYENGGELMMPKQKKQSFPFPLN